MAVAALESIRILKDEPQRRERLARLVAFAAEQSITRCAVSMSGSQVLPVIIGDDRRTMRIAAALRDRGFDVRGVRPPTVPAGTARLRISLTLNVDERAIADLLDALAGELRDIAA
jgi:8-amino-7-oxononanoate synthase